MSQIERGPRSSKTLPALFVLGSLTLMTLDTALGPSGPVEALRQATASVFGPPLGAAGSSSATGAADSRSRLRLENTLLRAENARLRAERAVGSTLLGRYAGYDVVPAPVLSYGSALSYRHSIAIGAGYQDGVVPGSAVVSPEGLVGRVIRVQRESATVLLVCDAESVVGVRLESGDELGMVRGGGDLGAAEPMTLRMLDSVADVEPGDRLVSWGSPDGHPYPPGLPVGIVTSVSDRSGRLAEVLDARPAADLTALAWVAAVTTGER